MSKGNCINTRNPLNKFLSSFFDKIFVDFELLKSGSDLFYDYNTWKDNHIDDYIVQKQIYDGVRFMPTYWPEEYIKNCIAATIYLKDKFGLELLGKYNFDTFMIPNEDVLQNVFKDGLQNVFKDKYIFNPESDYTSEMQQIKAQAVADGTFMKAPNGKPTNLNERQWLQVRTKAFKEWFGDWEKVAIQEQEKINFKKAVSEFEATDNKIDRKSIAISNLRPNEKTDDEILKSAGYIKVGQFYVSPNFDSNILSMIPQELLGIMYNAGIRVLSFGEGQHLAMAGGIKINNHSIGEIQFTKHNTSDRIAHNVLHEIGHYLYSHYLTQDKKQIANKYTTPVSFYVQNLINGQLTSGASVNEENFVEGFATYFHNKIFGKKSLATKLEGHLVDLYRELYKTFNTNNDASKVVDENGEPLVVYHGSRERFTTFNKDAKNRGSLTSIIKKGFYFSNKSIASQYASSKATEDRYKLLEMEEAGFDFEEMAEAFGFSRYSEEDLDKAAEYMWSLENGSADFKDNLYSVFLNIKSPATVDLKGQYIGALNKEQKELINNSEGAIVKNVDETTSKYRGDITIKGMYTGTDYIVFNPNQIKSATDNVGTFSRENDDIRYNKNAEQYFNYLENYFLSTLHPQRVYTLKQFNEKYGTNFQWNKDRTKLRYKKPRLFGVSVLTPNDEPIRSKTILDRATVLTYLQKKFNLTYKVLSDGEYFNLASDVASNCCVKNNTVYLRESKLNRLNNEQFIEEFLHPVIHDVYKTNETLSEKLLKEARTSFPGLCTQIEKLYEKSGTDIINEEIITQVLSKYLNKEISDNGLNSRNIIDVIKDFFAEIFNKFRDLFGEIDVAQVKERDFVLQGKDIKDVLDYEEFAKLINSKNVTFNNVLRGQTRDNKSEQSEAENTQNPEQSRLTLPQIQPRQETIFEKVAKVSESVTLQQWQQEGFKKTLGFGEAVDNSAIQNQKDYLQKHYPSIAANAQEFEDFDRDCKLNKTELSALSTDIAFGVISLLNNITNPFFLKSFAQLHPDIFNKTIQEKIIEVSKLPTNKQHRNLIKLIGSETIMFLVCDLIQKKAPAEYKDKLLFLNNPAHRSQMCLNINPALSTISNLIFNSKFVLNIIQEDITKSESQEEVVEIEDTTDNIDDGKLDDLTNVQDDLETNDLVDESSEDNSSGLVPKDSLTQKFETSVKESVRFKLSTIQKNGAFSIFNNPEHYTYQQVLGYLMPVVSAAHNSDDMIQKIKDSSIPIKDDILQLCDDLNFRSALFSTTCKTDNSFWKVDVYKRTITNENGESYEKVIYKPMPVTNQTGDFKNIISASLLNSAATDNILFYTPTRSAIVADLQISRPAIDKYMNSVNNVKELLKQYGQRSSKNVAILEVTDDHTKWFLNLLNTKDFLNIFEFINVCGLSIDKDAIVRYFAQPIAHDNTFVYSFKPIFDVVQQCYTMLNVLDTYLKDNGPTNFFTERNISQQKTLRNAYSRLSQMLNALLKSSTSLMVDINGRGYSRFSNTNYINRTFNQITKTTDKEFLKWIETNFKDVDFFKELFDKKESSWITDMYRDISARRDFKIETFSLANDKKFNELLPQYDIIALAAYGNPSTGIVSYMSPIFSDKNKAVKITYRRYTTDEVLKRLTGVFRQELRRIHLIYQRAANPQLRKRVYKSYDVELINGKLPLLNGGVKFDYLPMFNIYLSKINDPNNENEVVQYMRDIIYNGTSLRESILHIEDTVKKIIDADLKRQANELIDVWNASGKAGLILNSIDTYGMEFVDYLKDFYYNDFYAKTQMYQLLSTDLAFNKNNDDVIKRTAQNVSDGVAMDETAKYTDETGAVKQIKSHKDYIILSDFKREYRGISGLEQLYRNELSQKIEKIQKSAANDSVKQDRIEAITKRYEGYINAAKKYDSTDGQGYLSFNGYCTMLRALGRFDEIEPVYVEYKELYDEFAELYGNAKLPSVKKATEFIKKVHKFNVKNADLGFVFGDVKLFTYTQLLNNENGTIIKHGFQVKNAEMPLLDLETMIHLALNGDTALARLAAVMHKNDIDAAVFESNIKTGLTNNILSIRDADDTTFMHKIGDVLNNRESFVVSVPLRDVVLQNETPDHSENCEQSLGTQLKQLLFAPFNKSDKITINNDTKTAGEWFNTFDATIGKIIETQVDDKVKNLKLNGNIVDQNVALSKELLKSIDLRNKVDLDSIFRFSLNTYGNFNIPLSDTTSRAMADSEFTAMIKKTALEIPMPGGTMYQITDGFKFDESQTSLEWDTSLHIVYYDKDGNETTDISKGVRIAYFEAELPLYYKAMYDYYYKTGNAKHIPDELKQLVMYRIPTEGACSMFPIKVKRWSNKLSGGSVKLPFELPFIGGMDFDIDKLFFVAPSIKVTREKHFNKTTKKTHSKIVKIQKVKSINQDKLKYYKNELFDIIYQTLQTPQNMKEMLIPSNFDDVTYFSLVNTALSMSLQKNPNLNKMTTYKQLCEMTLDQLTTFIENNATNESICGFLFQQDAYLRSMMGQQLLARFANSNSQHVYLQDGGQLLEYWPAQIVGDIIINGNVLTSLIPFDSKVAQDEVTDVKINNTQFLTSSADAVKNPSLARFGVDLFTSNIVNILIRIGFDIETTFLLIQQPIVKYMSAIYSELSTDPTINYINVSKITNRIILEVFGKHLRSDVLKKVLIPRSIDITKEDLVKNLYIPIESMTKATENQFLSDQLEIFKILYPLLTVQQELLEQNKFLKLDNPSIKHGSELLIYKKQLDDAIKYYNNSIINRTQIKNFSEAIPKNGRLITSAKRQSELCSYFINLFGNSFEKFSNFVTEIGLPNTIRDYEYSNVYNDFVLYLFTNDIFGSNDLVFGTEAPKGWFSTSTPIYNFMINRFPKIAATKIQELRKEERFKNNEFLKHVVVDVQNDKFIVTVVNSDETTDSLIKDGLSELLNNNDVTIRNFAQYLIIYNFYRNGFSNTLNSIWKYVSPQDLAKMKNYVMFLNSLYTRPIGTDDFYKFLHLFYRNNPDKAPINQFDDESNTSALNVYANDRFNLVTDSNNPLIVKNSILGKRYINKNYNNDNIFTNYQPIYSKYVKTLDSLEKILGYSISGNKGAEITINSNSVSSVVTILKENLDESFLSKFDLTDVDTLKYIVRVVSQIC